MAVWHNPHRLTRWTLICISLNRTDASVTVPTQVRPWLQCNMWILMLLGYCGHSARQPQTEGTWIPVRFMCGDGYRSEAQQVITNTSVSCRNQERQSLFPVGKKQKIRLKPLWTSIYHLVLGISGLSQYLHQLDQCSPAKTRNSMKGKKHIKHTSPKHFLVKSL